MLRLFVAHPEKTGFLERKKLAHLEQAAEDNLFMADLRETMKAFANIDAQGWDSAAPARTIPDAHSAGTGPEKWNAR